MNMDNIVYSFHHSKILCLKKKTDKFSVVIKYFRKAMEAVEELLLE